ncbi:MAG: glycosyltransferase [Caulobacteraceae bacterium]
MPFREVGEKMHYYCTIVSKEYLHKGLMLYKSLKKYDQAFKMFFVCMNDDAKALLSGIITDNAVFISIEDVEREDTELASVKAGRNEKEYAWTSKASIFLYLFKNYPKVDRILWLDSDIVFFSSPKPIFDRFKSCSILLTKERFKGINKRLNKVYGIFNTGLMGFKRDKYSIKCLKWFREKCIEWCFNWVLPGKWSDQMYVNDWEKRFKRVRVIKHTGINVTAWNVQGCKIEKVDNKIFLDHKKLVFYHYSGFNYFNKNEFELCCYIKIPEAVKREIYMPYVKEYQSIIELLDSYDKTIYKEKSMDGADIKNYYRASGEEPNGKSPNQFCTIIGRTYLIKGLALYLSLNKNLKKYHLWVCCVDDEVYEIFKRLNLPNVTLYRLEDIEEDELKAAKENRSLREYCWTLKAPLILHIFKNYNHVNTVIYLDADTFIFSDLREVYKEWGDKSILLCRQRDEKNDDIYGIYQAGVIGFKKDESGLKCLNWWRSKCIEWCYDRYDDPIRWGDQKYMNQWTELFDGVAVVESMGIDTAAWYSKYYNIKAKNDSIYIERDKLLIYHFTSFFVINENEFTLWRWNNLKITDLVRAIVYMPYIKAVKRAIQMVKPLVKDISMFYSSDIQRNNVDNYYKC